MSSIKNWFLNNKWSCLALVILTAIYPSMLFQYGLHGVDDAWTLSLDYFYLKEGYVFDRVFGNGHAILAFFGKTHAFLYGLWAEWVGWGRIESRLLSTILVLSGILIWARILYLIGLPKRLILPFILIACCLDAFVSSATKIRPEALIFFLSAASLWLATKSHWFLAGLIACLAIEVHPIGISSLCLLTAYGLSQFHGPNRLYSLIKNAAWLLLAGMIGFGYYLLLHFEHLPLLKDHINQAGTTGFHRSSFIQYFLYAKWHRHLPEALIFIVAYLIFYKNYPKNRQTPTWRFLNHATLLFIAFDLLTSRGSQLYAVLAFPIFIAILLLSWQSLTQAPSRLVLGFFLLTTPQYAYLSFQNHSLFFPQYIQQLKNHTQKDYLYLGHSAHWFAFNATSERASRFYAQSNSQLTLEHQHFVVIHDSRWDSINANPSATLKRLMASCPSDKLADFKHGKHTVTLQSYHCNTQTITP